MSPVVIERTQGHNWLMLGEQDHDIADHLAWCQNLAGYTPATIRARRQVLNRLRDTIGRPLRDAQVGHIMAWEQSVVAGLAPQSRRAYIGHAKAFYRWCVARDIVVDDPTVMLTRPKVPKPLPRPIAEEDLARALRAASPKLAAMMVLMADAGLRCLEVAQLSWSDFAIGDGQVWLTVRNGKGGKDRLVPVGETVQRALRRYGTRNRGPVFVGRDGKALRPNSVSTIVNEHLRRLGIVSSAHKLRARYATRAAEVAELSLVAELCGWESTDTAKHYVKPNREMSTRVVAALDALAGVRQRIQADPVDDPCTSVRP